MPLYFGQARNEGYNNTFSILDYANGYVFTRGVQNVFGQPFGYSQSYRPAFIAGNVGQGWVNPGASGTWSKINNYCFYTTLNVQNCYNTGTTRFTAPIAGPYMFMWTTYLYTDGYVHPIFAINGNQVPYGTATGYGGTQYRIRAHGMVANYQQDAQIEEVINLAAGDYVEAWWYNSGTCWHYPYYSLFAGVFVG